MAEVGDEHGASRLQFLAREIQLARLGPSSRILSLSSPVVGRGRPEGLDETSYEVVRGSWRRLLNKKSTSR